MNFTRRLAATPLVIDGSMGAYLQSCGLEAGQIPDLLCLENPDAVAAVHQAYADAGADILLTNTFGATRPRLEPHGIAGRQGEIVQAAVTLARRAGQTRCFVAGDIGPAGLSPQPGGSDDFAGTVQAYRELAEHFVRAGVDLLFLETFFDLQEIRAAMIGVREGAPQLPIVATMTFGSDGRTDSGATPEAAAVMLTALGACAVGVNCSAGPEAMHPVLEKMRAVTSRPLACEPNAGLPVKGPGGELTWGLGPDAFPPHVERFLRNGVRLIGGCCGTTPETVKAIRRTVDSFAVDQLPDPSQKAGVYLAGTERITAIGAGYPFRRIGERLNPTGRKLFRNELAAGNLSRILPDARQQLLAGADALDINAGVPGADEPALMKEMVARAAASGLPMVIDGSAHETLEAGLMMAAGRPLLNSVNAEPERMTRLFPLARRYGAAVICLLSGNHVPESVSERLELAEKLRISAEEHGLKPEDLIFDPLALAVAAMPLGARLTPEVISALKQQGLTTVLGLSNVSHGLPAREEINAAFLTLCMNAGLDAAIVNPGQRRLNAAMYATSLFIERPPDAAELADLLQPLDNSDDQNKPTSPVKSPAESDTLTVAVLDGDRTAAVRLTGERLAAGENPLHIFLNVLTPAMEILGHDFSARRKFIPHLVAGAEAMKAATDVLRPAMAGLGDSQIKADVVFATVQGDVHDIGKNLCVLMLENGGYRVHDLGRSVPAEIILQTALKTDARIVCLSALMTTTMGEMAPCIARLRAEIPDIRVLVGGAVLTEEYSREIGADGYGPDAASIVSLADQLLGLSSPGRIKSCPSHA